MAENETQLPKLKLLEHIINAWSMKDVAKLSQEEEKVGMQKSAQSQYERYKLNLYARTFALVTSSIGTVALIDNIVDPVQHTYYLGNPQPASPWLLPLGLGLAALSIGLTYYDRVKLRKIDAKPVKESSVALYL